MIKGTIFDLKKYAIHDGPGIRTTVFFKGCPLSCPWCHNPESIDPDPQPRREYENPFTLDPLSDSQGELIGEEVLADDLMDEILKDRIYYEESGGGVTFSGGEPLAQPDFLKSLLSSCKKEKIHTAVDTSGYGTRETLESIVPQVNLFLFDLKLIDEDLHKRFTGVGNELILENLNFLVDRGANVELRFPMIPGITNGRENIEGIKELLERNSGLGKISILPFHEVEKKYEKLGLKYKLAEVDPPDSSVVEGIASEFGETGVTVEIGG